MSFRKLVSLAILCLLLGPATGTVYAGDGQIHIAPGNEPVPGKYLVTFVGGQQRVAANARTAVATHGGKVSRVFEKVGVAVLEMDELQAKALASNPNVLRVEQDSYGQIVTKGTQFSPPSWGLDRVDETTLPMDGRYAYCHSGKGVNVYVIDTGIRTSHNDFGGRATWGINCTSETSDDIQSHGTHVAGTAVGSSYGVAKDANVIAVKSCTVDGNCTISNTVCGIDYVAQQKANSPSTPAVANMSLRFGGSTTLDNAVNAAINEGVFFAVAAGNDYTNACSFSPARVTAAYTVGSTTSSDSRSSFSNYGTCLDIFAPGSSIVSAGISSNSSSSTKSGTSMASPHVAGAAALVLSEDNGLTPAQVDSVLDSRATSGVLSSIGSGSPNRLLYTKSASSCTSACSLVDLVPTLSGSSSKVTTSGTYSSSYPAWKAFDSNATSSSMWISETYETPAWIAYDFAASTRITHYTITNSNGSLTSRAPKDFSLQGWTGSSWVTVDSRTNETNWTSGVQRTYEVATPGNYTKYRLYITDDNDSRTGVVVISIANLELLGCEPAPLAAPNACFTTGTFGNSVSLNASCSSDSDGTIVSYSWDMGDGTIRSGQSVSHFYSQDGTYVIRLTVTDNDGLTDDYLDLVSVCQGGISPVEKSGTGEPLIPDCPVLQ